MSVNIKWDIFLSYAERDSLVADQLYQKIIGADLTCFMAKKDLRGKGGVDFSDYIRDSILSSREMVLLCSPNSIHSEWVLSEWSAAWVLSKTITPIVYQLAPNDLPSRLSKLQCIDVHDFDEFINEASTRKQSS